MRAFLISIPLLIGSPLGFYSKEHQHQRQGNSDSYYMMRQVETIYLTNNNRRNTHTNQSRYQKYKCMRSF